MFTTLLTVEEVNTLISEHFIKIFGNVVEHSTAAAIGILKNRPFQNAYDMYNAVNDYLDSLNLADKEKILQDYPDKVSKLSDLSRLMLEYEINLSGVMETNRPTIQEKLKLKELNRRYVKKFGFPFVCSGKESNFHDVFTDLEKRIENSKDREISISISEIKKISKNRILEIVR